MTPESTESPQRQRLARAWERAYGAGAAGGAGLDAQAAASRATADARAAWQRWHQPALMADWSPAQRPWFEALERARVEQLASDHLPGMARNLADPAATAPPGSCGRLYRLARAVFAGSEVSTTGLFTQPVPSPWPWRRPAPTPPVDDALVLGSLNRAAGRLHHPEQFAEAISILVVQLAENLEPGVPGMPQPEHPGILDNDRADGDADGGIDPANGRGSNATDDGSEITRAFPDYRIFSTAWDEERPASHWLETEDAGRLSSLLTPDRRQVRQLAHRLQRRLQAARLRQWQFDLDDGLLDSRRLARLVGDRANHRVFRSELDAPAPTACVCLLVDLSGSMRGERQRMAAMTVDLAVHTLESCGIDCEVLGYTTSGAEDNPLSARWRRAGSPRHPGRLNALRHVIFKTARQRWQRTRQGLGLMLREDFGQENIDGEALYWAARRLGSQPVHHRILMVLSDGQPFDPATVKTNGEGYLEASLRAVIERVDRSPIELVAVGTGMDVARFYRRALTVPDSRTLAAGLFDVLGDLLTTKAPSRRPA